MRLTTIGVAVGMILAACGEREGAPDQGARDSVPAGAAACSAAGLQPDLSATEGLPDAVTRTRRAIMEAAVACDYERLVAIARGGGMAFTYASGDTIPAAAYWRALEARGDRPMAMLVGTLERPYTVVEDPVPPSPVYVWPSASGNVATGFDLMALEGLYSDVEIASFIERGVYLGWRVGITVDGGWWFFVRGAS
jgi:hypothetical protein